MTLNIWENINKSFFAVFSQLNEVLGHEFHIYVVRSDASLSFFLFLPAVATFSQVCFILSNFLFSEFNTVGDIGPEVKNLEKVGK